MAKKLEVTEAPAEHKALGRLENNLGREDLNELRDKINEIIDRLN